MQRALRCVLRAGQGSTPIFSENEILASKAALAQPEALTAALNYYRASVRSLWRKGLVVSETVTQPTLVVWDERDNQTWTSASSGDWSAGCPASESKEFRMPVTVCISRRRLR